MSDVIDPYSATSSASSLSDNYAKTGAILYQPLPFCEVAQYRLNENEGKSASRFISAIKEEFLAAKNIFDIQTS